jgi:hypothetical protein
MKRMLIGSAVVTGLGSAFNLGDPYLYAAIAAGAIAGRFLG